MAIIKSFTDLPQSKVLAEFLPLESADNHYWRNGYNNYISGLGNSVELKEKFEEKGLKYFPCWSLAALLHILPPSLFEYKRGIDLNVYPNLNGKGWHCSYMPNCIENMKIDKFKLITSGDSLIDACYKMIIKLNELKML